MTEKTGSFVVFDTETTGLEPDARVVELAAAWVDVTSETVLEMRRTLVNPQMPIPSEATRLHGITDEMVREKPTMAQVLPQFLAFLRYGPAVAHYAVFDIQRIRFEAERSKVLLPGTIPVFCSIAASRTAFPNERSRSLLNLEKSLGLKRTGTAHRAASDVSVTALLALRCLNGGTVDWMDLSPVAGML